MRPAPKKGWLGVAALAALSILATLAAFAAFAGSSLLPCGDGAPPVLAASGTTFAPLVLAPDGAADDEPAAEREPAAPPSAGTAAADALRVRVVDALGAPITGHAVFVRGSVIARETQTTNGNGEATFANPHQFGPRDAVHVVVQFPGREVTEPLATWPPGEQVVVRAGSLGYLAIEARGAADDLQATIEPRDGAARPMPRTLPMTLAGGRGSVRVAIGQRFRVNTTDVFQHRTFDDVEGPRTHGEVVEVAFDFRRCTVRGTALGASVGPVRALVLGGDATPDSGVRSRRGEPSAIVKLGPDGAFAVQMPRSTRPATFVLLAGDRACEVDAVSFDADEVDLGALRFAARPLLGAIVTLDAMGAPLAAAHRLLSLRLRSGTELAADGELVFARDRAGGGVEYLGVRAAEALTVATRAPDLSTFPAGVVLCFGIVLTVRAERVASATILLPGGREHPFRKVWLVGPDAGVEVLPVGAGTRGDEQLYEFRNLRAGTYEVHANVPLASAGHYFTATAGGHENVHVTLASR